MKKLLPSLLLFGASMIIAAPYALAQSASPAPKKTAKPAAKKATPKTKTAAAKEAPATDDDKNEPDVTGTNSVDFHCELGNTLTIYENATDDKHIALKWNKRVHRLRRVDTSTGANRFENRHYGLVWIGIPAKGILLDSKKGKQLANECKNPEQLKQKAVAAGTPGIFGAPASPVTPATPASPASPATPAAPASPSTLEKPQS